MGRLKRLLGNLEYLSLVQHIGVPPQRLAVGAVDVEGVIVNNGGLGAFAQLFGGDGPSSISGTYRVGIDALGVVRGSEERATVVG